MVFVVVDELRSDIEKGFTMIYKLKLKKKIVAKH